MTLILTPLEAAGSGPKENEKSERGAHCARPAHVGFHVSFSNGDPHPHHAWAWARAPYRCLTCGSKHGLLIERSGVAKSEQKALQVF